MIDFEDFENQYGFEKKVKRNEHRNNHKDEGITLLGNHLHRGDGFK